MPGLGNKTETAVTPGRKTHVIYDVDDKNVVEHGFGVIKSAQDMAKSSAGLEGTTFQPGIGIQLSEDITAIRTAFWGIGSDDGVLTSADAFIPPGFVQRYLCRTKPEVGGAFGGTLLPPVSGIAFVKRKPATVGLDHAPTFRLDPDQAAFPGPTVPGNDLVMDRVLVSKQAHALNQPLAFLITVYGDVNQKGLVMGTAYFNGPAGHTNDFLGAGQYAAVIFDNGEIQLYERGQALPITDPPPVPPFTWKRRLTMKFPNPSSGANMNFLFLVRPRQLRNSRTIEFKLAEWAVDDISGASPQVEVLKNAAIAAAGVITVNTYTVPKINQNPPPTVPAAIRLDLPRPFRSMFRVKRLKLRTSGYVRNVQFSITQGGFLWGQTLRTEWYFDQQSSTDVTMQLKGSDGLPISPDRAGVIATTGQAGRWAEYDFPPSYVPSFWLADFHLTGDAINSPTLTSFRAVKSASFDAYEGRNIEGGSLDKGSLSIMDGGSDPSLCNAGWNVSDTRGEVDLLRESASFPVRIETEYDPEDPAKRVVLHRGYIEDGDAARRRRRDNAGMAKGGSEHPFPIAYDYDVKSIGRWLRIQETRDTSMFSFMQDPNAGVGVPYRVTDALKVLLRRCGYPSDMVDIPDSEIRLFPVTGADDNMYVIRPLSDLSQAISYLARDYLGAAIVDDENGGDYGKWKLVNPPKAPYTNKLYFTTERQPAGKAFTLGAYAAREIEEGTIKGIAHEASTAVTVPIVGIRDRIKRPVANKLIVTGVGYLESTPLHQLTLTMVNPDSYKHHPDSTAAPGPDNPDWLAREVPLWYIDPMLQTEAAVAFVGARLFPILCKGYKLFRVHAPLAFIDHEEGGGKKRKPRFGDPCVINDGGTEWQCVVRSCSPELGNDSNQMATYEIQQVRF